MGGSERKREIKRRRARRKAYDVIQRKLKKATVSEKQHLAEKLRRMTPSAELLIERWGLGGS